MRYISDSHESAALRRAKILRTLLVIGGLATVAAITVGVYLYQSRQPVIGENETKGVSFSVYAPKKSSKDFAVDSRKIRVSNRSVAYDVSSKTGDDKITVTVQPVPANFDLAKMTGSSSISGIALENGTLYNLSVTGNSQYLLNTGDALVFFTSKNKISTSTINDLASDLVKQN